MAGGRYDPEVSTPQNATNRLAYVSDAVAAGNYTYDAVGNLVGDVKEEIQVINWNQRGKIKEVKRSTGSQKAELVFGYSADGQRLYKKVKPRTGGNLDQEEKWETMRYVRDGTLTILIPLISQFNGEISNSLFPVTLKNIRIAEAGKPVSISDVDWWY